MPEYSGIQKASYFFTVEALNYKVKGVTAYPSANNEYIIAANNTPKLLLVTSTKNIISLKIYESNGNQHTGIVKYGDTVTIKIETRNYVDKELEFEVWKDIKMDNHTDD